MLAVAARFRELALEHAAAIDLADWSAQQSTVTIPMWLDAGNEIGAVGPALPGTSPSWEVNSNRLFSLKHFDPARRI
jgi:hypothetical protein